MCRDQPWRHELCLPQLAALPEALRARGRAYTKMIGGPAPTVDAPAEAPATKQQLTRTLSRQLTRTLSRKVSMTLRPAAEVPAPELADLVTAKDVLMELPPRLPESEIAKLEFAPADHAPVHTPQPPCVPLWTATVYRRPAVSTSDSVWQPGGMS